MNRLKQDRLRHLAAIAVIVLGCTSERGARDPTLVDVNELPAAQRDVLTAYGEGGGAWDEMRALVRADPDLLCFTVDNLALEMVRAHDALANDAGGPARRAHDRARAELVRLAPASTPVLVELLEVGDGVVAKLAGETLVEIGEGTALLVAPLLERDQLRARRRGTVLLRLLPLAGPHEPEITAHLARLARSDPDWFVRAEAARTLGSRAGRGRDTRAARTLLESVLLDHDPAVARYAAVGLAELDDPRAVPALVRTLVRAANEGEGKLLRTAQDALRALTGVRRDLDVSGWSAWWRDHGVEASGGLH